MVAAGARNDVGSSDRRDKDKLPTIIMRLSSCSCRRNHVIWLVAVMGILIITYLSNTTRNTTHAPTALSSTQTEAATCPQTKIFPFRVGCPQDCRAYRKDMTKQEFDQEEAFYRLTVEWYFGEPKKYNASIPWSEQRNSSIYYEGTNFQCPQAFVDTFRKAGADLTKLLKQKLHKARAFYKQQKRMHMSLAYLCCIRQNEVQRVREVIQEWIADTTFDFTLRFGRIQSLYEKPNAVTTIIVVDDESQRQVMQLLDNLVDRI